MWWLTNDLACALATELGQPAADKESIDTYCYKGLLRAAL